jgi:hypothetical protein
MSEYRSINIKRLEMLESAYRVALWLHFSDERIPKDSKCASDLEEFRRAQEVWFDAPKGVDQSEEDEGDSEPVSECCGSVGDEDVGLCPVCREHCEFVDPMEEVGKYTLDEVMDWAGE